MGKKKSNILIRIITAICFVWVLVLGARTFIADKMYESTDILTMVVAALPILAGLLMLIGALTGARVVFGIGSVVYLIYKGFEIFYYVMQMQESAADEARKSFRGLIIASALMLLAFLFLALACFNKKADLALCLLTAALFVAYFFVSRSKLAADESQLMLILTSAGSVLGTILMGITMALGKGTEKKKSKYLDSAAE